MGGSLYYPYPQNAVAGQILGRFGVLYEICRNA